MGRSKTAVLVLMASLLAGCAGINTPTTMEEATMEAQPYKAVQWNPVTTVAVKETAYSEETRIKSVVIATLTDLGLPKGATVPEMYYRANDLGLGFLPPDTASQLAAEERLKPFCIAFNLGHPDYLGQDMCFADQSGAFPDWVKGNQLSNDSRWVFSIKD